MKEYRIRYGRSVLDSFIFRPGAIKHLPMKMKLWLEIKYLKYKRGQIIKNDPLIKHACKLFKGKVVDWDV